MGQLFVDIGEFFTRLIYWSVAIPLWIVFAIMAVSISTIIFGPVLGVLFAVVLLLHYEFRS